MLKCLLDKIGPDIQDLVCEMKNFIFNSGFNSEPMKRSQDVLSIKNSPYIFHYVSLFSHFCDAEF